MATEIITNINSVLEQKGVRELVTFVQSSFNPLFYQFSYATGTLIVGDRIYLANGTTGLIINITGTNATLDTIDFFAPIPTFTSRIVMPPTAGSSNFDVRIVAAFNPVVITLRRKDFTGTAIRSTWNNLYYSVICGTIFGGETVIIPGFVVGATIQVIADNSDNAFNFTILNISTSGGFPRATFSKLWSAFANTFSAIINFPSRLNFYTTLRIKNGEFVPTFRDLRFTPDANAFMRAEISGALRSLINLNFNETNSILTNEANLSTEIYFAIKDNYIGSSETFTTYYDPEDVKYAIAGAFQIGEPKNGYYDNYFPNVAGSYHYPEYMPKFITQFENPVYFTGFPFTISFIINQFLKDATAVFLSFRITLINGTIITFVSTLVLNGIDVLVNFKVNNIFLVNYLIPYTNTAKKIQIQLVSYDGVQNLETTGPIILNVKRPLEQSCNTFYVRWLNTLGGWDYWLFEQKIYESLNIENGNNYESYFDTISDITDFENVTQKNVSPSVQVGTSTLTKNEAEGLKILVTSPKVYWYNEDIEKWIGVIVAPGTFNIRSSKDNYFAIELTLIKPKYFNQFA